MLARTADLIRAARGAGLPIIYVVVGFRPGYPEVSANNVGFSTLRGTDRFAAGNPGTAISAAVAPAPATWS